MYLKSWILFLVMSGSGLCGAEEFQVGDAVYKKVTDTRDFIGVVQKVKGDQITTTMLVNDSTQLNKPVEQTFKSRDLNKMVPTKNEIRHKVKYYCQKSDFPEQTAKEGPKTRIMVVDPDSYVVAQNGQIYKVIRGLSKMGSKGDVEYLEVIPVVINRDSISSVGGYSSCYELQLDEQRMIIPISRVNQVEITDKEGCYVKKGDIVLPQKFNTTIPSDLYVRVNRVWSGSNISVFHKRENGCSELIKAKQDLTLQSELEKHSSPDKIRRIRESFVTREEKIKGEVNREGIDFNEFGSRQGSQ